MLNEYALWRAIHVLAVLFWIGGVAFVTTILLPALRRSQGDYTLFELLEHRFGWQAKVTTQLTLISGLAMLWVSDSWSRLFDTWWLWSMVLTWFLFTLMLFVFEPFVVHRWLHRRAAQDRDGTLRLLQRMHYVLLGLGLISTFGGVIGAHGGLLF
jgi:uncharacterized membrane protein